MQTDPTRHADVVPRIVCTCPGKHNRMFYDTFEDFIARERETIAVWLNSHRPLWVGGPNVDLPTALCDVAEVNRTLADPALMPDAPRPGWRYKCSLVYSSGMGQRAFFRALRVGPRLASMVGTVAVDVEEVRVTGESVAGEEEDAPEAVGVGNVEEEEEEEEEEDGELVSVCRRMRLEQFYGSLRPALMQIAANAAAREPSPPPAAPPADGLIDEDDGLCSICMDEKLEVVTRCTHAFCDECYTRWLTVSRDCPLCRERLALELTGTNEGSYALVSWPDAAGDRTDDAAAGGEGMRVDAAWVRQKMAELPPVAEARRRAHERWLIRRMRVWEEKEGGGEAQVSG